MNKEFLHELSMLSDRHGLVIGLPYETFPVRDVETDKVVGHVYIDGYDGQYKERKGEAGSGRKTFGTPLAP